MSPVTHLLTGWMLANVDGLSRRERAVVTIAAVAPDADGFGAPIEALTREWERPILWFSAFHHSLGHNLAMGIVLAVVGYLIAKRRWLTASLAFLAVIVHLLADVAGGRGPDGYGWPLPFLWPLFPELKIEWSGQWELNAWPNFVITGALLAGTLYLAWRRGFSPIGIVSERADRRIIETLRRRFGDPRSGSGDASPTSRQARE